MNFISTLHAFGIAEMMDYWFYPRLIGLAFAVTVGLVLVIIACVVWQNGWPIIVGMFWFNVCYSCKNTHTHCWYLIIRKRINQNIVHLLSIYEFLFIFCMHVLMTFLVIAYFVAPIPNMIFGKCSSDPLDNDSYVSHQ